MQPEESLVYTTKRTSRTNSWYAICLLIIALYFPITQFELFHIIAVLVAALLFLSNTRLTISPEVAITLLLVLMPLIASVLNIGRYENVYLRDLSEVVRFLPALIILLNAGKFDISNERLLNWFLVYVFICFGVSVAQLIGIPFLEPLTNVYAAEHHSERALILDRRALGLSAGPGQNGALAAVIYSYAISHFCFVGTKKLASLSVMILSALIIVLSQSQTSFIVMLGISSYACIYFFIQGIGKMRARALLIFYAMLTSLIGLIYILFDKIKYLLTLFTHGFSRNSYQTRIERTADAFSYIDNAPVASIWGLGKEIFGNLATAMDNEYMFIWGIYGGFILTVVIIFYLLNFIYAWSFSASMLSKEFISLHFMVVAGIVIAWPSIFLTDPRFVIILSLMLSMMRRGRVENINVQHKDIRFETK